MAAHIHEEKEAYPNRQAQAAAGALPDASEVQEVEVANHEVFDGTVFYVINVRTKRDRWSITKRYSQFEELHRDILVGRNPNSLPPGCALPPKRMKLFVSHVGKDFIEERRALLEAYLRKLLSVKALASSRVIQRFLTSDIRRKAYEPDAEPLDLPEDAEVTDARITTTRTMSDHVLYQIDVQNCRKRKTFSTWTVLKRFGQFYDLDCALRQTFANNPKVLELMPPPPERKAKLFSDHMSEDFVEQRRVLLNNYIQKCLGIPEIIMDKSFLIFLGVSV